MIKRSPPEVHTLQLDSVRARNKRYSLQRAAPAACILAMAVGAFLLGAHLHKLHHTGRLQKIDAASLLVLPSAAGSNILFATPDGRRIILVSDLTPDALAPLLHYLNKQHIFVVNGIVLTNVTNDTMNGLAELARRVKVDGPVISPYDNTISNRWWGRNQRALVEGAKEEGLRLQAWKDGGSAFKYIIPQADITLYAPLRSKWEIPVIGVKVSYLSSSLLDISSLNPKEAASITGMPDVGSSRILVIGDQDTYVTREILAEVQPDIVLLAGPSNVPPGDNAEINIQAADATAITLSQTPPLKITLPASDNQPLKSVNL